MATIEKHVKSKLLTDEQLKIFNELKSLLINKKDTEAVKLLKELPVKHRYILNFPCDEAGYHFIDIAAMNYLDGAVSALKDCDAKFNNRVNHGYTCLHLLFEGKSYYDGSPKHTFKEKNDPTLNPNLKVQEAKKRRAIINLVPKDILNQGDNQEKTPIHFAIRNKLNQDVQWLIEAGAIVTIDDIHYAYSQLKLKATDPLIVLMKNQLECPVLKAEVVKSEIITQEPISKIEISNKFSGGFFSKNTAAPILRERSKTVGSLQKPNLPGSTTQKTSVQNNISLFEQKSKIP